MASDLRHWNTHLNAKRLLIRVRILPVISHLRVAQTGPNLQVTILLIINYLEACQNRTADRGGIRGPNWPQFASNHLAYYQLLRSMPKSHTAIMADLRS